MESYNIEDIPHTKETMCIEVGKRVEAAIIEKMRSLKAPHLTDEEIRQIFVPILDALK